MSGKEQGDIRNKIISPEHTGPGDSWTLKT